MNGPPPVILLSRQNAEPREFVADMAVYLIFCNGLALALRAGRRVVGGPGGAACWLPGAILGNALGLTYGGRLPVGPFRWLTLGLVLVTGLATVVTSVGGL